MAEVSHFVSSSKAIACVPMNDPFLIRNYDQVIEFLNDHSHDT